MAKEVNAKKTTLQSDEAFELARQVDHIYAAKGKRVEHIDLRKAQPDDETLRKLLLGPTGNLRAPTLRRGKTLIVGFDRETYEKLLS